MTTMTAAGQQYYATYPDSNQAHAPVYQSHQQQHHQQQVYASHQHPQIQPAADVYQQHQATSGAPMLTQLGGQVAVGGQRAGRQAGGQAAGVAAAAAAALYGIEATKSTKGASKMRRDLINIEIAQLRELLPLPASTRQRLSQLQLMALVLVYVRKSNYFCNGKFNPLKIPQWRPIWGRARATSGRL